MKHLSKTLLFLLFFQAIQTKIYCQKTQVLIIGGGASGTMAGIQAARMGVNTLIVEETPWLGGMLTSAGVSGIDGNHHLPSGLWGEFREELKRHYGGADKLATGWVSEVLFEPSVAQQILRKCVKKREPFRYFLIPNSLILRSLKMLGESNFLMVKSLKPKL